MCSITALLNRTTTLEADRKSVLNASRSQQHRGPDWSGIREFPAAIVSHERLAIVDVLSGAQPLVDPDSGTVLAVNGEIYNHVDLKSSGACGDYPFQSGSDCEVILALYRQHGRDLVQHLSGMYAFVLFDPTADTWIIARDPIGIIPLYYGTDDAGRLWVASEMKALMDTCDDVRLFPPGQVWASSEAAPTSFYHRDWMEGDLPSHPYQPEELNAALTAAVYEVLSTLDKAW